MGIQESGQMYLKTIYELSKEKDFVKSIDVAKRMGFSKPSVSRAIHTLEDEKLIILDGLDNIKLTDEGLKVASSIVSKYDILVEVFLSLGIKESTARDDACKIEHDISNETVEALKKILK